MKIRGSHAYRKVAAAISPAGLMLRLFAITLFAGPLLLIDWTAEHFLIHAYLLGTICFTLWRWVSRRVSLRLDQSGPPDLVGRPIAGVAKLFALLAIEERSALRSLTGPATITLDATHGLPTMRDVEPSSRIRLWAEASLLLVLVLPWTVGMALVIERLGDWAYAGFVVVLLGVGMALIALLQRISWGAGAYPLGDGVWGAPVIPATGENRFRAMVALDGRVLVRPDVLEAPYLPYLLAHERAHLAAKSFRLVWLEQALCITILVTTGLSVARFGPVGLLPLLLVPVQHLLFCRLSYQSELRADQAAAAAIGIETCLGALERLAEEAGAPVLPGWLRHSPTIQERIEYLQRFKARPGQR